MSNQATNPNESIVQLSTPEDRTRVLKHEETFSVFDRNGDVTYIKNGEAGIFHQGTRLLSCFQFLIFDMKPFLLNSSIQNDNSMLTARLTNPDIQLNGKDDIVKDTFQIVRKQFLYDSAFHERLRIKNFDLDAHDFKFSYNFAADFVDLFEVRGSKRQQRGQILESTVDGNKVILAYRGLDEVIRKTVIEFVTVPDEITESKATFSLKLEPKQEQSFDLKISFVIDEAKPTNLNFDVAQRSFRDYIHQSDFRRMHVSSSNELLNEWLSRSYADLQMMITETEYGSYPYAGVPWFNTAFGRDGLISAYMCLNIDPSISKGVLSYLAHTQAQEFNKAKDAEPGKIMHETRQGEMANLKEIPFGLYFGTVDATPLFVMLAAAYYERTGDLEFVNSIWSNIEAALTWINNYGDRDNDGYVEYFRESSDGIANQGWKDAWDSVFYNDGDLVNPPVALCEVQSYVYSAKLGAAKIARQLAKIDLAQKLEKEAEDLKFRFNQDFWSEELGTYVLALDGQKKQCKVKTSNAGHCLMSGIASDERALKVARQFFTPQFFSGWGIRTLAKDEVRYNPMSYHNGSIWPHDNGMIALGFQNHNLNEYAAKLFTSFFEASIHFDHRRLPELFCGFSKEQNDGPTLYPVACSPQAWATVVSFSFLQASLGLKINGLTKEIVIVKPVVPEFINNIVLSNIQIGNDKVDIEFIRHSKDVGINILNRVGDIKVVVIK
jgi:glycogen debranching enzyme